MKAKNWITGLLLLTITLPLAAQKQLTEGTVVYNITIESQKGETPIGNGLDGAVLTLLLKPSISRTDMSSTLGTETTVFDNKAGKGFILKEYSGQKLMITANRQNWLQKNQWNDNMRFVIDPEIRQVAGYACKKATSTTQDGKAFSVYFTPDITVSNTFYNNSFAQLPGLPVQYELQSGNLLFRYTLSKISFDPVPSSKFEIPKTGFRVMTYEENQQLKRADRK